MKTEKSTISKFIAEPITAIFYQKPAHKKSPPCPNGFEWRDKIFSIKNCMSEWKDFARKGKMTRNMQPQHAEIAEQQGSWGVGRFYFEVQTKDGRFFRLYYDRAPKNAHDRNGSWILLAELNHEVS